MTAPLSLRCAQQAVRKKNALHLTHYYSIYLKMNQG